MSKQFNIRLNINEISKWSSNHFDTEHDFSREAFANDQSFLEHVGNFPPKEMFKIVEKLIVEEGVEPDDVQVFAVDDNGEEHAVNIPLGMIYESDKKINDQINSRVLKGL